jgi:hypothetical protein
MPKRQAIFITRPKSVATSSDPIAIAVGVIYSVDWNILFYCLSAEGRRSDSNIEHTINHGKLVSF